MEEPRLAVSRNDGFAPEQRWRWLRPLIPKRIQPALRGLSKRFKRLFLDLEEPYKSIYPFTQVHPLRQRNLVRLAELVVRESIPGMIVECGVLDGGTAALMAWATRDAHPPRPLHLFDAWEGLPPTTAEDGADARIWTGQDVGSMTRVLAIQRKMGTSRDRLHLYRGWFDQTFPKAHVPQVALAHIDCDFYEPTKLCLEKWYPVLSPGGFMQFDDYDAFSGCKKAVDSFLAVNPELRLQTVVERVTVHFFQKPKL